MGWALTTPRRSLPRRAVACLLASLTLAACGEAGAGGEGGGGGELVVFAAASLTDSFTAIEREFEAAHPRVDIRMSFAGSSALAQQIARGAPAGVFASANPAQMRRAVRAGEIAGEPATFARNRLRIAVPVGNPADVRGPAAFGKAELTTALCAEQVPCGRAARKALRAAGVTPKPDTLERDVKAVLTKVRLGEVDAGLVYRTDVLAAGDAVAAISFPAASRAANEYRIAALRQAPNAAAAGAFVEFVRSERAKGILGDFGFDTSP